MADQPSLLRDQSIFSRAPSYSGDDENTLPAELLKAEEDVTTLIRESQLIHESRVAKEIGYFFHRLGLDPFYFRSMDSVTVGKHITALYAAKMLSATSAEGVLTLCVDQEKKDGAMYMVPSLPTIQENNPSETIEYRIEREYLEEGYEKAKLNLSPGPCRVQVYRTWGTVSESSDTKLRLFFVQPSNFNQGEVDPQAPIDFQKIADKRYIDASSEYSRGPIAEALKEAQNQLGPVVKVVELEKREDQPQEIRIVVAYRHGSTHSFFSGLTALYHYYGLHSTRKYIERYANGLCSFSLYLFKKGGDISLTSLCQSVAKDASLIYILPRSSLSPLFKRGILSAKEVAYSYIVWKFAHQFYSCLSNVDDLNNFANEHATSDTRGLISKVSASIKREMLTEERVKEIMFDNVEIMKDLYADFEAKFLPGGAEYVDNTTTILAKIKRHAGSAFAITILSCMCMFNRNALKTNFYKPGKVALSVRLDPAFLSHSPYPRVPFAIFFVVGAEFRGFHVRFVDVARGGIRVIRSANDSAFALNVSTLFQENYNLAHTQQRKNKDIPEGGSKGTILLSPEHQDKALVAFKKYVDSLLDLLLPHEAVRDYYKEEELLFLGPDEGTADFMDWASHHAKERSYKFWKAFTTGKARALGGIPHDFYGMTTQSIHQYVLGILEKQGLNESDISKFQTGGPDGDLGSNEIKISKDKTIAVVDGSGVLYDREGIHREELTRLANARLMTDHFDVSKLSPSGFYVSIQENDKKLPDGSIVESGMMFRNTFHLKGEFLFGTDMFVPCGGRPAAVNANNVHHLWDEEKNAPMFKYIVEGANLFFTQEARLQLEKWGVILFKDASANKGGVTSSSLEVLAALSLTDAEFSEHMQVRDGNVPVFYEEYVAEVQRIIQGHARNEFNCLWKEYKSCDVPLSILSDQVSEKINQLNLDIFKSSLWANKGLRERVISASVPKNLIALVGVEGVMSRVPEAYLKAIFGAHLACNFVYSCGLNSGEFGFFEFMQSYLNA